MTRRRFKEGDAVIYTKAKYSRRPGPRATEIMPEPRGEHYRYKVDKLWIVARELDDGLLELHTRRGKRHVVPSDDPNIRHPTIWERLRFASRFPHPEHEGDDATHDDGHEHDEGGFGHDVVPPSGEQRLRG